MAHLHSRAARGSEDLVEKPHFLRRDQLVREGRRCHVFVFLAK